MNRRQFLTAAAAVPVAAAVALPELARTIILPPRGGWPTWQDPRLVSTTRWFLPGDPPVAQYVHTTYGLGFAVIKEEGGSIEYDRPLNEQSLKELVDSLERYGARGLVLHPARVFS